MTAIKYCTDMHRVNIYSHIYNKGCGYCRGNKKLFDEASLKPKGFCVDAFYSVYPYLLALLYDAKFAGEESLVVSCPNSSSPSLVRVGFKLRKFKAVINFLEKAFRMIGFPKDAIDKDMWLEVVQAGEQCTLAKGDIFNVNIPQVSSVCPAAFFSIYPLLYLYHKNYDEWKGRYDKMDFICPDPKTCLGYDLDFSSGDNKKIMTVAKACDFIPDLSRLKVVPLDSGGCALKGEATVSADIPKGMCPFIFNIAIPYIITFQNGGYFKWRKDINTVQVQCPNACAPVSFQVRRDKMDGQKITVTIEKVRGTCLCKHKEGQSWDIDPARIMCMHLFSRSLPYILLIGNETNKEKYKAGIIVTCPFHKSGRYLVAGGSYA